MAAPITHLVIGERVFRQIPCLDWAPAVYGTFLAGCVLVDVHAFSDVDRRQTHFVGRIEEDGEDAYSKSCSNFIKKLDALLRRPWDDLEQTEQSFVAGYLCHLAVDECWKELGWRLFQVLGIRADFVVPGDVGLTAFDFLSREMLIDVPTVDAVLKDVSIPDVLTHVSHEVFRTHWDVIQAYVLDGGTPESHFEMLERAGKPSSEILETRQRYDTYWESAIDFTYKMGGIEPFVRDAIGRAIQVMPQLWSMVRLKCGSS